MLMFMFLFVFMFIMYLCDLFKCFLSNVGGAMHFIYYINRLNSHESRFNLFGLLNQQYTAYMSVAGLERMTTVSAVNASSYRATQVDKKSCVFKIKLYCTSI